MPFNDDLLKSLTRPGVATSAARNDFINSLLEGKTRVLFDSSNPTSRLSQSRDSSVSAML